MINLLNGDCLEQMKQLDDNSVDSIELDPDYYEICKARVK